MKTGISIITSLVLTMALSPSLNAQVRYSVNSNWEYAEADSLANPKEWSVVNLPHTWNAQDATDDVPGYRRGKGLYRKHLILEPSTQGKQVYLHFEGANQETSLRVNGREAGIHVGGYSAFNFDITPYLSDDGSNLIEVTVDNSHNPLIPPLSADFTFFGGIYRDVFVEIENPVHISNSDHASSGIYINTPTVNDDMAQVDISLLIDNNTDSKQKLSYTHVITAPDGSLVKTIKDKGTVSSSTKASRFDTSLQIDNPRLWSPETPQLYTVITTIEDANGQELDRAISRLGLRWFNFDPDKGFSLNGKPVKLVGVNRHQDYPGLGYAANDEHQVRDMKLIKDMGVNFLRVSHYPQDPLILQLCDQMGIMASVETPIVNAVTQDEQFLQNSLEMQREMVKQGYNHPSVIIWAYMNEVMLAPPYWSGDEYKAYCVEVNRQAQQIDDLTHQLDPGRYTMIPFHNGMGMYEDARLFDVPDIIGWNLYQGWYSGDCSGLQKFLDSYHERYPNKPTIMTEYGADCNTRLHSTNPQRFDYTMEYGDIYHEHYLRTIKELDYLAGANIWNLIEFHSESRTYAVPHFNLKGIVTSDRKPKNTYWLYKANFSDEPFVKIASTDWLHRAGQLDENGVFPMQVKVYSNGENVKLWHNGALLLDGPLTDGLAAVGVPFVDGVNIIEAQADDNPAIKDIANIHFDGLKPQLDESFSELNVLLGSNRIFYNPVTDVCWIPDQEYKTGSWGYIGGEPYTLRSWTGNVPSSDIDLLGTCLDPMYQTARRNIEHFRADVPDGQYALYLYWADLTQEEYEKLVYNLGNDAEHDASDNCFGVSINGKPLFEALDVRQHVGRQRPMDVRTDVIVTDGKGIDISLTPVRGETMLHAVRIIKL